MIPIAKSINILGTEWIIIFGNENDFPKLQNSDGYTDSSSKEIVVEDMVKNAEDLMAKKDLKSYRNQVLRHEIVHAFLCESGLDGNGHATEHWEINEEMVDWFAIQSPKIFAIYKELDIL